MRSLSLMLLVACTGSDPVDSAAEGSSGPTTELFTEPLTTINGEVPPGELLPLQDTIVMIDIVQDDGNRLVVTKGTRLAGTRVGIHVHKYGGHTCVLSGEITDFVEGQSNGTFPADTCYYMPPNVPMAAANLGTEDAVLVDTFILPPGEPTITILEPGYDF